MGAKANSPKGHSFCTPVQEGLKNKSLEMRSRSLGDSGQVTALQSLGLLICRVGYHGENLGFVKFTGKIIQENGC